MVGHSLPQYLSAAGARPPISLPSTPDSHIIFPIEILNHELDIWGFTHDLEGFRKAIVEERHVASITQEGLESWADKRGEWADRGRDILVRLERYPFEEMLEFFCPPAYFDVWTRLRHTAFLIMHMLATVEFYLDL